MGSAGSLCSICRQHFVTQGNISLLKSAYGNLDEITSREACAFCKFFESIIRRMINDPSPPLPHQQQHFTKYGCWIRTFMREPRHVLIIYNGIALFECRLVVDDSWLWALKERREYNWMAYPPPPRIREWPCRQDGSVIDASYISTFINGCCGILHGSGHNASRGCGHRKSHAKPMRLDLIDVHSLRLIQSNTAARYVTLSYVWGQCKVLEATKANRDLLRAKAAFERHHPATVIQDAMLLVRKIGERYLWVDSLCIPQDDAQLKASLINRMDYIYSQSVLTIIAASTRSALDPLPGVRPNSRNPQVSAKIRGMRLVRKTKELDATLEDCVYEQRAWTFQERVLSQRCLIMTELESFLCCSSLLVSEIYGSLPEGCERLHSLQFLIPPDAEYGKHHDIARYSDIITAYCKRCLTYDTDILRAFAGVSAFLEAKMTEGRMLLGHTTISLAGFAHSLAWISDGPTERRAFCASPQDANTMKLPSWAWAGWTGGKAWPPQPYNVYPVIGKVSDHSAHWGVAIGLDNEWEDLSSCNSRYTAPSKPLALRFTAEHLPAHRLCFKEIGTSVSFVRNADTDRASMEIGGIVLSISEHSGLVYGVEQVRLEDDDVSLIAISQVSGDDLEGFILQERTDGLLSTKRTYDDPNIPRCRLASSYFVCIVARWIDVERTTCERIGLAHVWAESWRSLRIMATESIVNLV